MPDPCHHVLLTGIGPVSPVGIGAGPFLDALAAFPAGSLPATAPGAGSPCAQLARSLGIAPPRELSGFDPAPFIPSQKTYLDRASGFAFAAARLAMDDAGLDLKAEDPARVGILLGTAYGSLNTMDLFFRDCVEKGPRSARPFLFPHSYQNTAISLLAIEYGIRGFHTSFASGFTASAAALLYGHELVRTGRADVVLAGGVEALAPLLLRAFHARNLLAPAGAAGPFDRHRTGFVLGEGGAMLCLESEPHARARGARVYAELAGGGMSGDAPVSGSASSTPDPARKADTVARTLRAALAHTASTPDSVGCIVASANGDPSLDLAEGLGIAQALGDEAARPLVTSLKGALGETAGAGAALHLAAAAAALHHARALPTPGLEEPDPRLALRFAPAAPPAAGRLTLVQAVDPGGSAVTLGLRAWAG